MNPNQIMRPFIPATSPYSRPNAIQPYAVEPAPHGTSANPLTQADLSGGALGSMAQLLRLISGQIAPPWLVPPNGAQPFDYQGLIATPAVGPNFTSIINIDQNSAGSATGWTVPIGYYAVIRNITHNIVGPGFVQGSGSLIWQFRVNGVPVKGFGAILTEFGNITLFMRPIPAGLTLTPNDHFEYLVRNVAYLAGGTQVVATINGWLWPVPNAAAITATPLQTGG